MHAQTPAVVSGNRNDNGWVPQGLVTQLREGCGGSVGRKHACGDARSGKREWNDNGWAPPQQRLRMFSAKGLNEAARARAIFDIHYPVLTCGVDHAMCRRVPCGRWRFAREH
jgi:hypothetical protein